MTKERFTMISNAIYDPTKLPLKGKSDQLAALVYLSGWVNYCDGHQNLRVLNRPLKKGELFTTWGHLADLFGWSKPKTRSVIRSLCDAHYLYTIPTPAGVVIRVEFIATFDATGERPLRPSPHFGDGTVTSRFDSQHQSIEIKEKKEIKEEEKSVNDVAIDDSCSSDSNLKIIPKKKRKDPGPDSRANCDAVARLWAEECPKLPQILSLTDLRLRALKTRLREVSKKHDDPIEYFRKVFKKVAASDFCNGSSERGWTADWDWVTKPSSHLRVMEGKYDNRLSMVDTKKDVWEGFDWSTDKEKK